MDNKINNTPQVVTLSSRLKHIVQNTSHTHFMLDVETDGLETSRNSMTSMGLVQFIPGGDIFYSQKLHVRVGRLPNRISDSPTMKWRKEHGVDEGEFGLEHANSIKILSLIREKVLNAQSQMSVNRIGIPHIYSVHKEFDMGFINSYFEYRHAEKPWHFRNVFCIDDLIMGMGLDRKELVTVIKRTPKWKDTLKRYFDGSDAIHNAFYDCLIQIEVFNYALKLRGFVK